MRVEPCSIPELVFRMLLDETMLMEQQFSERIGARKLTCDIAKLRSMVRKSSAEI
jgi:hypothetical protein